MRALLSALFFLLSFHLCVQVVWGQCTVQGYFVDQNNNKFTASHATFSIRSQDQTYYGPTVDAAAVQGGYSLTGLSSGITYEFGMQIPDGYQVYYSLCYACTDHPNSSFVAYGAMQPQDSTPLLASFQQDGDYIDLWWMLINVGTSYPASNQLLTCNFNGFAVVPPNTWASNTNPNSPVGVQIGVSSSYAGITTSFQLIYNGADIDILDARSAAGSAFQTSFYSLDPGSQRILVWNQAAGNMADQWGFSGTFDGTSQTDWSPFYTDHWHPGGSFSNPATMNAPCYNIGYRLHNIQSNTYLTEYGPYQDGSYSTTFSNAITLLSLMYNSWQWLAVDQALYMMRTVGRANNFRIYLVGQGNSWSLGPLSIIDDFTPWLSTSMQYFVDGSCSTPYICEAHTQAIAYAVFVHNLNGADVATVIRRADDLPYEAILQFQASVQCNADMPLGNDECGNMNWHSYTVDTRSNVNGDNQTSFQSGEQKTYLMQYEVGTPQQMAWRGYPIPNYPSPPLNVSYTTSNNVLSGWSENIADGGCYSSNSNPASGSVFLAGVYFGATSVSHIYLTPRVLNGQALGFPTQYTISLAVTSDLQTWYQDPTTYTATPSNGGVVEIWIPTQLAYAISIVPTSFGTDEYGVPYFQLCGLNIAL